MPLFKLPFEEKRPIKAPFAGHAQPVAERLTGITVAGDDPVLAAGLAGAVAITTGAVGIGVVERCGGIWLTG